MRLSAISYSWSFLLLSLEGRSLAQTTTPIGVTNVDCRGPKTPGELRQVLLENYDKYTRPGEAKSYGRSAAPPEIARVQMHVLSLNDVDQKRNEFEISVWFRRSWYDHRLTYATKSDGGCFPDDGRVGYPESMLNDIWSPDFYIENEAKPSSQLAGSFWIHPDGKIIQSAQLELTLACNMKFDDFPHDTQHCGIRIGTFLEDASSIVLDFFEDRDPVTIAANVVDDASDGSALPRGGTTEWTIQNPKGIKSEIDGALTAESAVVMTFELDRNAAYYADFVIIPAVMFVAIGWYSFFLDRAAAPARVAMSMIGFLANSNFLAAQLGQLPRLGNDVFLLKFLYLSSWFSFYSIIEYVICNHLRRIKGRIDGAKKRARENIGISTATSIDEKLEHQESSPLSASITKDDLKAIGFKGKLELFLTRPNGRMYIRDEHLDIFSRYAYPTAYVATSLYMYFAQYHLGKKT